MNRERRSFLGLLAPAVLALPALSAGGGSASQRPSAGQGRAQGPSPKQTEPPPAPKPDTRGILKANQKDIKRDVDRLAELAQELKQEVEKTDSAEVLSLPLVRKAEEIEKLAKHIKSLARG